MLPVRFNRIPGDLRIKAPAFDVLLCAHFGAGAIYPYDRANDRPDLTSWNHGKIVRQRKTGDPVFLGLGYFGHGHTYTIPERRPRIESTMS